MKSHEILQRLWKSSSQQSDLDEICWRFRPLEQLGTRSRNSWRNPYFNSIPTNCQCSNWKLLEWRNLPFKPKLSSLKEEQNGTIWEDIFGGKKYLSRSKYPEVSSEAIYQIPRGIHGRELRPSSDLGHWEGFCWALQRSAGEDYIGVPKISLPRKSAQSEEQEHLHPDSRKWGRPPEGTLWKWKCEE